VVPHVPEHLPGLLDPIPLGANELLQVRRVTLRPDGSLTPALGSIPDLDDLLAEVDLGTVDLLHLVLRVPVPQELVQFCGVGEGNQHLRAELLDQLDRSSCAAHHVAGNDGELSLGISDVSDANHKHWMILLWIV